MKVTHFDTESRVAYVQLTRRNLQSLIDKLDYNAAVARAGDPAGVYASHCELISPTFNNPPGTVVVLAVEDAEHYSYRTPGPVLDNATGKVV